MIMTSRLGLAAAVTLLVGAAVSAQGAAKRDTVRLTSGESESGTVKTEDIRGLTLTLANGKTQTYPWAEVADVQYSGAPEFTKAVKAFREGAIAEAMPQLAAVLADTKARPVLRQQALYYHATGLQRSGQFQEAIAEYKKLVEEFPDTRFLVGVADGLVTCHVATNDVVGGRAALEALASAGGADPGTVGAIEVRKAGLLEAEKKYDEAAAAYGSAARRQGMTPAQIAEARLGVARCKHAKGDPAAETGFRELIADQASGRQVLAGAWNGIGDILRERGKAEKSADRLQEALFAYLRGCVQYSPAPGEPTTEYERSLAGAAQCFRFIAELEQDAERRKLFSDRAKERTAQLEREFPHSPFLKGM
jgi:tetratricopeptide (TPR) repeat protein